MHAALRAAYAEEFIQNLPEGLDTIIGDRGVKLSGGQRQRIALARLILQNPSIIIFDEALNALDADSESKIQKAIDELFSLKTRIMISHRLVSVKNADTIYVLQDGRIVEKGTWDELSKNEGLFAMLKDKQDFSV